MLLFCKKNNVEVSAYSVLTPTFIIEPNYMPNHYYKNILLLPLHILHVAS